MTGMSRQPASFCKAATTSKPSISGIIRSSRITSGLFLLYTVKRFATVLRLSHSPLWTLEPSAHPLALDRIILHHQHARGSPPVPETG